MSPKNLNVSKKTHKFLLNKLKDKRILQIYKKFESNLDVNNDFIVAISGGPDSLALSFYNLDLFLQFGPLIHQVSKDL